MREKGRENGRKKGREKERERRRERKGERERDRERKNLLIGFLLFLGPFPFFKKVLNSQFVDQFQHCSVFKGFPIILEIILEKRRKQTQTHFWVRFRFEAFPC